MELPALQLPAYAFRWLPLLGTYVVCVGAGGFTQYIAYLQAASEFAAPTASFLMLVTNLILVTLTILILVVQSSYGCFNCGKIFYRDLRKGMEAGMNELRKEVCKVPDVEYSASYDDPNIILLQLRILCKVP